MQASTCDSLREQLARVNAELARQGRYDSFYTSLEAAWARYGSLTERQEAALRRSLASRAEREAQRAQENATITSPTPRGRVTVSGEVISTKWHDNRFGGCLKMLLKSDAGWKVWGTVPASLCGSGEESLKGCRVTFSATIEPKEPAFGFFSRPTNARVFSPVPAPSQEAAQAPAPAPAPQPPAPAPAAGKLADIIAQLQAREAK